MPGAGSFLILPMQPTPNGRLHIGHAAGPYLRADVLARHLRREGRDVAVICGSDIYENWVLLTALHDGRTPEATVASFHDLIAADLANLQIEVDVWINPLETAHHDAYRRVHEDLIRDLAARGEATQRAERVPFSSQTGRWVIGVWLLGRCPNCGAGVGGNACEKCGFHFQPAEVVEPRSRLDEGPLEWATRHSWFLMPTDTMAIARSISGQSLRPEIQDVVTRYLEQTSGLVRLSQPGSWGLRSELVGEEAVLSNTFYAFSLYCGQVYADLRSTASPFLRSSAVTTVGFAGVDNTIAAVVGPHAMATASGTLKPFDWLVVNEFLDLEGAKCSTSRHHGIWVSDLLENSPVTADELRYYMAQHPLERQSANFTVNGLVNAVNEVRRWLKDELMPALSQADGMTDGEVEGRLHAAVVRQGRFLQPEDMSLASAVAVLDDWMRARPERRDGPAAATSWLHGVALLAEPFLPSLADDLWLTLGLPGRPSVGRLSPCHPAAGMAAALAPRGFISRADVLPFVHLESVDA